MILTSVENECFRMSIAPEEGGKILDLIDRASGRNLLVPYCSAHDLPFPDGATFRIAGWDEAVPTVEASAGIPELGYAWRTPATCAATGASLATGWEIPDWHIDREIALAANRMTARYRIANVSAAPAALLWAAHALFSVQDLVQADLPGGRPVPGPLCDVDDLARRLQLSDGRWQCRDIRDCDKSWKFFLKNRQPVVLSWRDVQVEITGDMPWWGIWINEGRYGPPCLGIEPTNTPSDAVADATQLVAPGAAMATAWQLTVRSDR